MTLHNNISQNGSACSIRGCPSRKLISRDTYKLDSRRSHRAFTLIDLLVIIVMLAFGIALLAPALARTRPSGQLAQCLSNLRRLIGSWQMYSADNSGRIVVSLHGGETQGGAGDATYGAGWAQGWLDWTLSPDNTNIALLLSARYARLGPYVSGASGIFRCPANSYVYLTQRMAGWTQRTRSYSANLGVGAGNAETGPWDSMYRRIIKESDFIYPGPAENYVYVEEHPDSINDPGFFNPHTTTWVDVPATFHNGACNFAFADGHCELHAWTASLSRGQAREVRFTNGLFPTLDTPRDADIGWMIRHAGTIDPSTY